MKRYATLTVIGKDRSGVVARFTGLLFELGANIEALEEQVQRGQFSMTLQASWPSSKLPDERLQQAVQELARTLKMECVIRILQEKRKPRCAVLVTRESHCLAAILAAKLPCQIVLVAGNHDTLRPLAEARGIPFRHLPWQDRRQGETSLQKELEAQEADFVVLARFMKILSPDFVWRWKHKILNIHPSLLPAFPGANAYRQAFEHGAQVIGVTAHIVTPGLDEGPILSQDAFRAAPDWPLDRIVRRGQQLESQVLLRAMRLFLQKRFDIYWGRLHAKS